MGVGKGEWHVVQVAWGVVVCERTWRVGVAGRGLGLVVEVLVVPVSDQAALDKDWEGLASWVRCVTKNPCPVKSKDSCGHFST